MSEPGPATLPAEVSDLLAQLDAIERAAVELVAGLTDEQLNWSPDARWSIAQCLEHVSRTVALYPDAIRRMITEAVARAEAGRGPYREGRIARWVVAGMEPPPRTRVRTSRAVTPPARLDGARVLADFRAAHQQLAALARASAGVDLGRARMRSPFLRLIRFTLRQVLFMNASHARRHLWQARQVLAHSGFPRA